MLPRIPSLCGVVILSLGLAVAAPAGEPAGELPAAARWIPDNAIFVVEVTHPEKLLEPLLEPGLARAVTSTPAYRKAADQPGFRKFLGAVAYVENKLGTDWKTALRSLLGDSITLAALPGDASLLMVDSKDAAMLGKLHEVLLDFARVRETTGGGDYKVASQEYKGVRGWSLGPDENHIILGRRLVVSNRPQVLKGVLDSRADPGAPCLAGVPAYRDATRAADPGAAARLFVHMKILKQHPPVMQALTKGHNPLAALLFAGILEGLRNSDWAELSLGVNERGMKLGAVLDGSVKGDSGPASFARPRDPARGALPDLRVPRRIAAATFYRDLHGFYAAKDELFPDRTSGLIFFENMMGIFFSGLDLTEEVLAETEPEVRLVVAGQKYDPSVGTPRTQWPGFAAVFRLKHPKKFGMVVEEAWQKAIGLVNFTRGQQALPGLVIDRVAHAGTKFTVACYRPPKKKDGAQDADRRIDPRYNLSPSMARVGSYLVLSSAEGLTRDLIDALRKEEQHPPKPLKGVHSRLEIGGRQLLSILSANREQLVRNNMLEKGSTREEAENSIDLLLLALRYLGDSSLSLGNDQGRLQATLELELRKAPEVVSRKGEPGHAR